jgi:hypothetical protein
MDYAELFGHVRDDVPTDTYPLEYRILDEYQQRNLNLLKARKRNSPGFHTKAFCRGGMTRLLICH